MKILRRALVLLVVGALTAAVAVLAVGFDSRGDKIHELRRQLAASRLHADALHDDALAAAAATAERDRAAKAYKQQFLEARDKLRNPMPGRIRVRALASLHGDLDNLVPRRATMTSVDVLPAAAGLPEQVLVQWRGPYTARANPSAGVLVWQARRVVAPAYGAYPPYMAWRLVFDWRYDGTDGRVHVGVPGHERTHEAFGVRFGYAIGDVTADGHADVLASLDSGGSGGCRVWRVLSATGGATHTIFTRTTCDTEIDIVDGQLQVEASIHRPGCNIHGCGDRRRTLLRWTGSGWAVTSETVVGTPSP